MKRRELLRDGLLVAGSAVLGAWAPRLHAAPRFEHNPFSLGVASGYPDADSVVVWTRLAPEPLAPDGGMPAVAIPVTCEIALDEQFRQVARTINAYAEPEWAHSVHVEVSDLEPARPYWYRFSAGDARSPVGRTW